MLPAQLLAHAPGGAADAHQDLDVPDPVLGFRASGELTSDDYRDVLVPAVKRHSAPGTRSGSFTSSATTSPDSRPAPPGRTPRSA